MDEKNFFSIKAIDIHSHLGPDHGPIPMGEVQNGSAAYLLRTMKIANIGMSVNTSRYAIMPRGSGYTVRGNQLLLEQIAELPGVYGWVTVDPHEPESYTQAEEMVKHPKILGLKIHPEEHEYNLVDFGDELFSLADRLQVPLLGHSGGPRCMPEVFCHFANCYPNVKVIAAHLGSGPDGDPTHHIRAIEENLHGNLYTDTSSAMSVLANLLEYAVGRIGADHILFGTDSSCYFSPSQRIRVEAADISEEDKNKILRENALMLFPQLREELN